MLHESTVSIVSRRISHYYKSMNTPLVQNSADPEIAVRKWVSTVVVGLDLCPFAKPALHSASIRLKSVAGDIETCLRAVADECALLDREPEVETTLLILATGFSEFDTYLDLVALAEALLADLGYEGTYQLASFHPEYQFDGTERHATENFTNRSPYPILHLLRESSITLALDRGYDPEGIPTRNIKTLQQKGRNTMVQLLDDCFHG